MLKFISNTVGQTTKTITNVLKLVDIQVYLAIEEATDDVSQELAKLTTTEAERIDLRAKIANL